MIKVNGSSSGNKIGLGITLKVMAGDQFSIRATSWYKTSGTQPGQPANPVSDLLTALISGVGGLPGTSHLSQTVLQSNTTALSSNITQFLNDTGTAITQTKPRAFVNWVLFDNQMNYVSSSSGFDQVGNDQEFKHHVLTNLPIDKSGYLYIYVSNETPNISVFFDNLQVTHVRGPMLEENQYYPFGLLMQGINDRALKTNYAQNKFLFNRGTELQSKEFSDGSGLELYETHFRNLDPQLGKFWQIDPLTMTSVSLSQYQYANNNPILFNDPFGLDTIRVNGEGSHKIKIKQNDVLAWTIGKTTSYYTYDPGSKNAVDGFVGNGMNDGSMAAATVYGHKGSDKTSPWQLGAEWLTGYGPRVHNFHEGDPFTRMLQDHDHIDETRDILAAGLANKSIKINNSYTHNYSLGGLSGVPKYLRDYSTLFTFGLSGNLAVTYLGSYGLKYEVVSIDEESGTAEVHFHVSNTSTIESATHPPVIGYTQWWSNNIGTPLNNYFSTGPLSPTSQTVDWTETIKYK